MNYLDMLAEMLRSPELFVALVTSQSLVFVALMSSDVSFEVRIAEKSRVASRTFERSLCGAAG